MSLSIETLQFLRNTVAGLTLSVGAPDFEAAVGAVTRSIRELDQELAERAAQSPSA